MTDHTCIGVNNKVTCATLPRELGSTSKTRQFPQSKCGLSKTVLCLQMEHRWVCHVLLQ